MRHKEQGKEKKRERQQRSPKVSSHTQGGAGLEQKHEHEISPQASCFCFHTSSRHARIYHTQSFPCILPHLFSFCFLNTMSLSTCHRVCYACIIQCDWFAFNWIKNTRFMYFGRNWHANFFFSIFPLQESLKVLNNALKYTEGQTVKEETYKTKKKKIGDMRNGRRWKERDREGFFKHKIWNRGIAGIFFSFFTAVI